MRVSKSTHSVLTHQLILFLFVCRAFALDLFPWSILLKILNPLKVTRVCTAAYLARDNVAGYDIAEYILIQKYDWCL